MPLVPVKKEPKVAFFRSKIDPWTLNSTAIGTTASAVSALDVLVTAAQDAIDAQTSAYGTWRTAVEAADNAVAAMGTAGADIISAIRTKGRTGGAMVYTLAQIPAPATPTPVGPPGVPYKFDVELRQDGSLSFKWKCDNPAGGSGTFYQVWRAIGDGELVFIGGSGGRSFLDETIPQGTSQVTYKIYAARTTAVGSPAEFTVKFGMTSGGAMIASIVEPKAAKLAA